jgi:Xaa-Pro aminopeptidase
MSGTFDAEVFGRRIETLQRALRNRNIDALVCVPGSNMTYLSGFDEQPGERHLFLFVTPDRAAFLLPEMYAGQVAAASPIADRRTWTDGDSPRDLIASIGTDLDLDRGRILLDDRMWEQFSRDLRESFPDAEFGLASDVLDDLRIRKDPEELDRLQEVASLTDEVCRSLRGLGPDAIGMTETDLANEIESRLMAAGGEGVAFESVVGSGPNGARPHHRHGNREIEAGDPVVLDFGTTSKGYPSDQTRTIVFDGEPTEEFERAFEVVEAAQQAGIEAIEPDVEAQAIDRAVRDVIREAGYGERFTHRTGHGVGLSIHEPPYIVAGNDRTLEPGMVFSVEPGIYVEGAFGIRIEDLVVVTETGCERLNDSPHDWQT